MTGPCVVFDVVGTCFGYDSVADKLENVLASHATISSDLFFKAWMSNAEVDFQRLSVLQKFRPHSTLLKKAFHTTMQDAGIASSSLAPADIDRLIAQYADNLTPRPGLAELMHTLRAAGFTVYCCSDASPERVQGYFAKAGIEMPIENLFSCDMCKAAKPDPKVYRMVKEKLASAELIVFAAAHAWDLAGARNEGFGTAYYTVGEDETCVEVFGEADVVADTLPQLASAIVQKWGKGAA
ncbi:putative 2-haloalkanoic acid dehalogenase [Mycena metata]|uniref:2-haloalkanoic acid dehalogenase n=1 Tax=Mycena metata TaxID=1033252 RepID=A0AAD7MLC2_9AGAR|nr:putative 2-haloalkanoic acid dehalogenase [Mycena metata]